MSVDHDDLFDVLPAGSPLHDLMLAELAADPVAVAPEAAARVAAGVQARLPRRPWAANTLVAFAAAATMLLAGAGALQGGDLFGAASSLFADPVAAEAALRTEAVQLHTEARQADDDGLREQADAAYAAWFDAHEGSERDPEMRYAWAELAYDLGAYDDALDRYLTVLTEHPDHPRAAACAQGALYAADQRVAAGAPEAVDAFVDVVEQVEARDDLGDTFLAAARYKAAYHLFLQGRGAEARPWFEAVMAEHPESREAPMALNLVLDGYAGDSDYVAMAERLTEALRDTPGLVDDDAAALAAQLVEGLRPVAPDTAEALGAAHTDWMARQLEAVGYIAP